MSKIKKVLNKLFTVSEKNFLLTVFILSLLIRIGYGLYYFIKYGSNNFDDDWTYIKYAQKIMQRGFLLLDISNMSPTETGVGPVFPGLIMLTFILFGYNFLPMIFINAIMSALLTLVIYYLGKIIFSREVGILSAIWSIIYVSFVRYVPTLLKENYLQLMFPLLILCVFIELKNGNKFKYLLLLCITFIMLIHADERYFIYSISFVLILFLDKTNNAFSYRRTALFVLLVFIMMMPWLIRNYYVYDRPVILTERTAVFTDKLLGYQSVNHYPQQIQVPPETLDSIIKGQQIYDVTLYNLIQRGLSFGIIPRKYTFYEKLYVDFKEFYRPFRFNNMWVSEGFRPEGKWSVLHNLSLILTYGILLPFFILGIIKSIRVRNKYAIMLFIIVLIHTLMHLTIVLSQYRYRIHMDAFIIIFAFYSINEMIFRPFIYKKE